MPLYEYRCTACGATSTALRALAEAAEPVTCEACQGRAERIVSRPSVHRSKASKVARLDSKYDRMVDRAMATTPNADPDRHLRRMKPLPE
jgi:putative FmdB family regulatory protein